MSPFKNCCRTEHPPPTASHSLKFLVERLPSGHGSHSSPFRILLPTFQHSRSPCHASHASELTRRNPGALLVHSEPSEERVRIGHFPTLGHSSARDILARTFGQLREPPLFWPTARRRRRRGVKSQPEQGATPTTHAWFLRKVRQVNITPSVIMVVALRAALPIHMPNRRI